MLCQRRGEPPSLHPCAYYSKKLSPAELNYDIRNRVSGDQVGFEGMVAFVGGSKKKKKKTLW